MDLGALLKGKKILITGASSGLGEHFAKISAKNGAHVAIAARRADRLAALSDDLKSAGAASVSALNLDVTQNQSVEECVAAAAEAMGGIDVLMNNAGVANSGLAVSQSEDDYDFVLDTNLKGVWMVANASARIMGAGGNGGSIINIASVLGLRVAPGLATYNISKAAVVQLTKTLAVEWADSNIRVNALAPGYFQTEINSSFLETELGQKMLRRVPMKRKGEVDELTGPFLLLATDAGAYITGEILSVDGGHAVNPV